MHIELVSFSATAPGASGAAGAALAGDSLTMKNSGGAGKLIALWAKFQTTGFLQLAWPSGHDTTRGLRLRVKSGAVDNLLPEGLPPSVEPQETLTATIAGSATAGDVESACALVFYPDVPGMSQRGIDWNALQRRFEKLVTVDNSMTAAAAGYTGEEAINADSDLLQANRDYAVLGCEVDTAIAAVTMRGPDTAGVKIGMPGNPDDNENTINFFPRLSRAFGQPIIPVINSGNRANTLVGLVADENTPTVKATFHLALLGK
jgi:hypothetical protein